MRITCQCGKQLNLADKYAGRRIRCPQCQSPLIVEANDDEIPYANDDAAPMSAPSSTPMSAADAMARAVSYGSSTTSHRTHRRPVKKRGFPVVAVVVILLVLSGVGTLVGVILSQNTDRTNGDQTLADKSLLIGTWLCVESRHKGGGDAAGTVIIIRRHDMKITFKDGLTQQGTLVLDPSVSPKIFDFTSPFGDQVGIYKLDGDTLTLCWALDHVKVDAEGKEVVTAEPRPNAIDPSQGLILIMKRQK